MLTVTNSNDFDFIGRHNGQDYQFPSGKTTALPDEAACHIFGVGNANKEEVLVRHGWIKSADGIKNALKILNKFSFNVADQLTAGEIIDPVVENGAEETEHGSAPMQTGSDGEAGMPDGIKDEPSRPAKSGGNSILDQIPNF